MRVCCRKGDSKDGRGAYGRKAARECDEDMNVRWKGIDSVTQNSLDDGTYS